ncbi:hypothetical protein KSC_061270 [Ktedonobacter sp. SOSP1-52]|uniref:mersacidin/lichenicidin family type 2 lantibiotic n=1 Tax=Ktedonobacter sp. SOSP1-52 TaxID=2778366 RepID=UPI001916B679|nr:mersacidin/lichenicidin family type 2 lantibiotic [Ktedonobacter sp. SOSP1-52]GHO67235.1 hypothetical protein KSC_061270 [Ktedonobacter sp. SOSP1-52]
MQFDMTRAWKDEEYRESLSQEQQAQLESPAGEIELDEAELEQINGTGGYGGGIGGGIGKESYKEESAFSAFGVKGNSYFCGNYSYRPQTNLNLGNNRRPGDITSSKGGGDISLALTSKVDVRANRFDFGCSISGGIAGTCLFGGN